MRVGRLFDEVFGKVAGDRMLVAKLSKQGFFFGANILRKGAARMEAAARGRV